jgi:hypothetical protein
MFDVLTEMSEIAQFRFFHNKELSMLTRFMNLKHIVGRER